MAMLLSARRSALLMAPTQRGLSFRRHFRNGRSLVEKIVQNFSQVGPSDRPPISGDYASITPLHVMTHDNTGAVMKKFSLFFSKNEERFFNHRQPVFAMDHNIQDTTEANLAKYRAIQKFAEKHGIDFYPAGRGIGHQVMCEEGYAWPLTLVVASDSHSNMYGGLGCLGTPVVRTDAAAIWATGKTWWQVPPVAKVELTGQLRPGVVGKDVIISLCGLFSNDAVLNHAVEFCGPGAHLLDIEDRLTIANMTTEWGALAGLFPTDEKTLAWLTQLARKLGNQHPRINEARIKELERDIFHADHNASYATHLTLDLSSVSPHVAGPNDVKTIVSLSDISRKMIAIQKAYIVSCVNSRAGDLRQAADVIRASSTKTIAPGVEMYIAAASDQVQRESTAAGDWQVLLQAGARPLPPGCGPCIGLGAGLLQDGEVGISATNRNFKGRMGSPKAQAYLASPAVVAASALAGYITAPQHSLDSTPLKGAVVPDSRSAATAAASSSAAPTKQHLENGFPATIAGRLVFCPADNLNTDGIYPSKYTYKDDISLAEQAKVVMENYDPAFVSLVNAGDVLLSGFNFGTGSSREQAATALKAKGIPLVLAGSFSETYKRNAINNGFLAIEVPGLVHDMKAKFGTHTPTVVTTLQVEIDFENSLVTCDSKKYPISPIGAVAQQLILTGGLENWVKHNLQQQLAKK